jgi:structure-specific recognition protein 1/high mobility group protein B1
MVRKATTNIDINTIQKQLEKLTIKVEKIEKNINVKNAKPKKEKKMKDPNMPKKNMNSYMHFYNEFYKEYLNKNNEINVIHISKLASEEWNKIKENPKKIKKYNDMAIKDKERYEKEINKYKKPKQ